MTFGTFGMKKDWKNFVDDLDVPVDFIKKDKFDLKFLHKNEFEEKYKVMDAKFPSAYLKSEGKVKLFISQEDMNAVKSIDELKSLVNKKIVEIGL